MRSNLITVVTAVASVVLVASVASADQVQEQFRLMEQRMAEMEDRLEATSDDLRTARATVDEQQSLLSDAGLVDASDQGLRSAVGSFFESVDISGVAAASYNHRLIKDTDSVGGNSNGQGEQLFKNPNANTFQVDQIWLTMDKAPTEESRGGFHVEFATGASSQNQGSTNGNSGTPYLYSGYVSYLAPVGNGVQVDLGRLGTVLGAEVVQTNGNWNITQGAVFGLQPVTYNGAQLSTAITDEISIVAGVVNDVYSDTDVSADNEKAYFGQISYTGDSFGLNVGAIGGSADAGECEAGAAAAGARNIECNVSVVDVVLSADPTDDLSVWLNYDWKHVDGSDATGHGDTHGISGAGRLALSDDMGFATRVEYIVEEDTVSNNGVAGADDNELLTVTGTIDKTLAESLVGRLELRYDTRLDDNNGGFATNGDATGTNNDALVALVQLYYEF